MGNKQRDEAPGRRAEVLAALRRRDRPASITDLAAELGIHANTVRFHLEALTDSRQVERVSVTRTGPGRPALMFQAHRGMDPAGPRNYQLLADVLVTDLEAGPEPHARAVRAGRAWGSRVGRRLSGEPAADLVGLLDELGFAPEAGSGEQEVRLRNCPFLELATDGSRVVCSLHLGLLRGAMGELDQSVEVTGLDPFVEPDLCLVRLAPRAQDAG